MIAADQPTIFGKSVVAGVSSANDGTMKFGTASDEVVAANRVVFLRALTGENKAPARIEITYTGDDFCRYKTVSEPGIVTADAVLTRTSHLPLFLPLGDCTGAILYSPETHSIMVSHLGRHSVEQHGGTKSVDYFAEESGTDPKTIQVWLSPSPNQRDYTLWAFDQRGFHDVITEQLIAAGVRKDNIEACSADTVTSPDYFSHSQFLKGLQAVDGRYAVCAMLP